MNLFGVFNEVYPTLLEGLGMTIQITVISLLIAMVLGIILVFEIPQKTINRLFGKRQKKTEAVARR